jgi:membrane fusion protein (multidrug efflux system)
MDPWDRIVPVVVAQPEERSLEDTFLEREATLVPLRTTTLSAQQEGLLIDLFPEAGDLVHAGDAIAQLAATSYELKLDELRADLHKREVTLAERKQAWARTQELYRKNVVSIDERDERKLELDRAKAEVEEARARVTRQETDLLGLRVLAPFPGVISSLHTEVGTYLKRGDAIVELKQIDWVVAVCTVNERDLRHVHEGATARVTLPAFPDRLFEGLVWKIIPDAVVASRSFPVKIILRNSAIELKPGMSARIAFVRNLERALLVPKDAVVEDGDEKVVWTIKDGKAERRPVEIGTPVGDRWQIRSGLEPGEGVVVTGNESLKAGMAVEVVQLPPPGPPTLPAAKRRSPSVPES